MKQAISTMFGELDATVGHHLLKLSTLEKEVVCRDRKRYDQLPGNAHSDARCHCLASGETYVYAGKKGWNGSANAQDEVHDYRADVEFQNELGLLETAQTNTLGRRPSTRMKGKSSGNVGEFIGFTPPLTVLGLWTMEPVPWLLGTSIKRALMAVITYQ